MYEVRYVRQHDGVPVTIWQRRRGRLKISRPALHAAPKTAGKRFLGVNSSAIVSIASLAVAAMSLVVATLVAYGTINSQAIDQQYKELAIRPRLRTGFDTGSFGLWLSNVGLGPAVIRRIVFFDGKVCKDSNKELSRLVVMRGLEEAVRNYFFIGMPIPMTRSDKVVIFPMSTVTVPTINTTLEAGKSLDIISFDKDDLKKYSAALDKIDQNHTSDIREKFYSKGEQFPMGLEYCSMSGIYCAATGNFHPNCDKPNFKVEE